MTDKQAKWRFFGYASPVLAVAAYVGFLSRFPGSLTYIMDGAVNLVGLILLATLLLVGVKFLFKRPNLPFPSLILVSSLFALTARVSLNLFVFFASADV